MMVERQNMDVRRWEIEIERQNTIVDRENMEVRKGDLLVKTTPPAPLLTKRRGVTMCEVTSFILFMGILMVCYLEWLLIQL